jgi:fucose permease
VRTLLSFFREPRGITVILVFAIHGVLVGTLFSRIAELQSAIRIGDAGLGLALTGLPAGVFVGSLLASRLIERQGTRMVLIAGFPAFAVALVLASLAFNTASLFAAIFLFGLALTNCNISMNVEADRVEAATGVRVINRCHGTWGIGFLAASLGGTVAVAANLPPTAHFVIVLLAIVGATLALVGPMQPSPPRAHRGQASRRRFFALPTLGILLILGFAASGILLEGTTRSWSIIYLRGDYAAPAWVTTLSLPAITVALIAGRFLADRLIDRFGPVRVAMVLSAVAFVGLSTVVLATSITVALLGFLLIGFGISTVYPQTFSAAAQLGDRPSSENVAALATLQTVLGFATPPLFGFIAARYGIRTSFAMILPLPILSLFFARYLRPRDEPAATAISRSGP